MSPSGPKCPRECPRKRGVSAGVSDGVSPGPFKPALQSVQKVSRVPRVSKRCPEHSGDTLGTLFGHSGAQGPKGPGDTPSDTPADTPRFRGHARGHSGHEGAQKTPAAGRGVRNASNSDPQRLAGKRNSKRESAKNC